MAYSLEKYVTISVPADVKRLLEEAKGSQEWGTFLLKLHSEAQRLKSKKAFDELAATLTSEDLKAIRESSREFREQFTLK